MLLRSLLLTLAALGCASAQSFEVATIKPNSANDNRAMIRMEPGGRFNATGMTVKALIGMAFNVRDFQVQGAPGWLGAERFDVSAKAPDGMGDRIPMDQIRVMLRALLEERFQLKTHEETKESSVYALVLGKNGHKMTAAEPGPSGQRGMMTMGRGQLKADRIAMPQLAQMLSGQLGRTVLDKTELAGEFNVKLEWTPEVAHAGGLAGPPSPDAAPPTDNSGPTIFTALQEQLGLRLESTKGPVQMIVIDKVERPSEN
jgi:uncharacterized protein (TIGR03435 family)